MTTILWCMIRPASSERISRPGRVRCRSLARYAVSGYLPDALSIVDCNAAFVVMPGIIVVFSGVAFFAGMGRLPAYIIIVSFPSKDPVANTPL
ncbi:hypothetical protein ACOIPX_005234 [Salmonella enterica]|nr:hypothetical protein [Salmonella enterica]EDU8207633.1 hypothetical protein [Salmonella enterica subsp. diarizonae]